MRTCVVSGPECTAPAGWRVGSSGNHENTTHSTRGTCFGCGEPVCRKDSRVIRFYDYGRRRVCYNCQEDQ